MRVTRSSLLCGLAALSLLLAPTAGAAPKKAKTMGGFDVADAVSGGKMKGVVKAPGGNVVLLLEAKLTDATPSGANGVAGTIDGVLRSPATGNVVAHVKGKYAGGPGGKGKLEAVVLKPTPGSGPPALVGKLKAHWNDPNPVGTPGKFKGRAIFK